ncbi:4319_t:CDS:1, partial [Paraglomus brasilianum]
LISKYPDSALELMKAMNDLPLNQKIVWSNQEDLYAFTRETDEVHEISAPREPDEINEANK